MSTKKDPRTGSHYKTWVSHPVRGRIPRPGGIRVTRQSSAASADGRPNRSPEQQRFDPAGLDDQVPSGRRSIRAGYRPNPGFRYAGMSSAPRRAW